MPKGALQKLPRNYFIKIIGLQKVDQWEPCVGVDYNFNRILRQNFMLFIALCRKLVQWDILIYIYIYTVEPLSEPRMAAKFFHRN